MSTADTPWRLAVYSRSLPSLTPEAAVQLLPKLGYDGIEWRIADVPAEDDAQPPSIAGRNRCCLPLTRDGATRARLLCHDTGVQLVGITGYPRIGHLDDLQRLLEFAQIAGAPQVRVITSRMSDRGFQVTFEENVAYFSAAQRIAQACGVKIALQIHQGSICSSASLMLRLVSQLDPQHVGVIFDPGGMAAEGFEDYRIGLELLGNYLCGVWVKNSTYRVPRPSDELVEPRLGDTLQAVWTPLDQGNADIPKFLGCLRRSGYAGWLTVCDFSQAYSETQMLAHTRDYLRTVMHRLETT